MAVTGGVSALSREAIRAKLWNPTGQVVSMDGEQKGGKLTVFTHIKRDDQLRKAHEDPHAAADRQLRTLTAVEARLQVAVSTLDEATATLQREQILVEELALGLISRGTQRIRRLTLGLALAVGFLLGIAGGVLAASLPMHSGLHRLEKRVDRIQQELQQREHSSMH